MGTHSLIHKFDVTKYRKLIASLFGAALSAMVGLSGNHFGAVEAINIAIALIAVFQVWYVTETNDNPHGKSVISGVAAALAAAQTLVATHGHLAAADWSQIGVAALTAAGILSLGTTAKLRLALPASYSPITTYINASSKDS